MKRLKQILRYIGRIAETGFLVVSIIACGGGGGGEGPLLPPDPDPKPDPVEKLEVKPETVPAIAVGGTYTVEITASGAWTATCDSAWCTVSKSGNILMLNVKANPWTSVRTTNVKVTMSSLTKNVTVNQNAAALQESLEVGEPTVWLEYNRKEYYVAVTANVEWSVSCEKNWCMAVKDGNRVKLILRINDEQTERSATVTVKGETLQRPIAVSQRGITSRGLDSLALVEIFNATDGNHWKTKWDTVEIVTRWKGVRFDASGERVEELTLRGNRLTGKFPVGLQKLSALKKLDLGNNDLSGNLPAEIGQFTQLESLSLDSNRMEGSLPVGLSDLIHLRILDLGYNAFGGDLPGLSSLTGLAWLRLAGNSFTGSLPENWKALKALAVLDVSRNGIGNAIPTVWMSGLLKLEYLYLYGNRLEQGIPAEITNLYSLKSLALDNNRLTGAIPEDLGLLCLENLWLYNNSLTGDIPASLIRNAFWSQWLPNVCPQQGIGFTNGCFPVSRSTGGVAGYPLPDKGKYY